MRARVEKKRHKWGLTYAKYMSRSKSAVCHGLIIHQCFITLSLWWH